MIFDGRRISAIHDDEIMALVDQHISERGHLEFKLTVSNRTDDDKLESLLDIASLANAKGGYLLIGIRDDGKGRAQKFEPTMVGDVHKIASSLHDLCLEHISERIEDLEIVPREVRGNPLVIIRVPESLRRPHMVTFRDNTFFYTRYESGKRSMTLGEIREQFTRDDLGTKLLKIESAVGRILKNQDNIPSPEEALVLAELQSAQSPAERMLKKMKFQMAKKPKTASLLHFKTGEEVSEAARDRFIEKFGRKRCLWLSITPVNVSSVKLDPENDKLTRLLENPPGSRTDGWNMQINNARIDRFRDGILWGTEDFGRLELCENGHMEFMVTGNELFFWKQSEEEMKRNPRLWPYVLIEFPVSFLRLYRAVIDLVRIRGPFLFRMIFTNLRGVALPSRMPIFPSGAGELREFPDSDFEMPPLKIDEPFKADEIGFEALKQIYACFGFRSAKIPFYSGENQTFTFPSNR